MSTAKNSAYDVIVIGGGPAGLVAAIQAGRAGAQTMLVEKTSMLGGTTTNGGVNFPGLFHAWGRQVIGGIGWELVTRSVAEAGGTLPDFTNYQRPHWQLQIRVNPFIYAALCDQAVLDAGVDLLLHTMLAEVEPRTRGWRVALCTKGGDPGAERPGLDRCYRGCQCYRDCGFPEADTRSASAGHLVLSGCWL